MREMKDSGVEWAGWIPKDWTFIKLKYLFDNSNAGEVIDKTYWNIGDELLYTCQKEPMPSNFSNFPNSKRTTNRDLLLTRNATPYIFIPEDNAIYSNVVQRIRVNKKYDRRYVKYALTAGVEALTVNGDTIPSYNMEVWKNISIAELSLEDQISIINYLDEKCSKIDAIIERQQAVIEKLKAYKLSVITEAVTKGLNQNAVMKDSGEMWIGQIPEHWKVLKLRTHTSMLTPMRDKPEDLSGDIPWVRIEDYDGKYIFKSKENLGVSSETVQLMNLKIYPVGTILCTSSCDLGKCAIVSKELVSNQRFIGIIPDEKTNSDFLYYLMMSNYKRLNFLSTGTIQANLSRVAFEHLLIQFPPLDEQKQIANYLDAKVERIERIIANKESVIERLQQYKKSLIYEVVTGKKEV